MKSKHLLEAIYRVEYRNNEGKTIASSTFFRYKEDAQEFAEKTQHKEGCPYICKYFLK